MTGSVRVSGVQFAAARETDARRGLLGWIRLTLDDLVVVDGIALRRTLAGRLVLSYPVRHDSRGGQHSIVLPINDAARSSIEAQVFAALNLQQEIAP